MKPQFTKPEFRIVFMGTPHFAVESLKQLITHQYNVVAVVTAPDKPAGRGQKLQAPPVKEFATLHHIPVLQPTNLKDAMFIETLKGYNAHLNVIVAFRMLPEAVWNMPPLGSINVHASLLPQYRGAAPINWAIINGETQTGVTTFFLKHEIDTGDLLQYQPVDILPHDNAGTLHDKLMVTGAQLLDNTLTAIINGNYTETPQSASIDLKTAPKIFKTDCKINWNNRGVTIVNQIRGLSPVPSAWCELQLPNQEPVMVKIYKAVFISENHQIPSGTLVKKEKGSLAVAVTDGYLLITELQMAGKKRMTAEEFQNGVQHLYEATFC